MGLLGSLMDYKDIVEGPRVSDDSKSQEIQYDKRFVSRWVDRCIEVRKKSGTAAANDFFRKMFSKDIQNLINEEIRKRKKK